MNNILLTIWVITLLSGCVVVLWSEDIAIEQDGVENHTATGSAGKTKPTFNQDGKR